MSIARDLFFQIYEDEKKKQTNLILTCWHIVLSNAFIRCDEVSASVTQLFYSSQSN